jgi:hypothetical protein
MLSTRQNLGNRTIRAVASNRSSDKHGNSLWLHSRNIEKRMSGTIPPQIVDAQFLRTELALAETVLETARISGNPEHVAECVALGREVLHVVSGFLLKLELAPDDHQSIDERLESLTAKLAEFSNVE